MVANKDMHKHALMTQKQVDDKDAYIPFDTSMALAEGFVPDEAKQAALTKANTHLEKGEKANAVEALKLANIDVSVSAAMIPAAISLKHVEDAVKLLSEKKYYEANLALKAVEDSVLVETYDINAIPAQGTKVKS
jgi:Ser-tRNA(Ala) deacylase AlaX